MKIFLSHFSRDKPLVSKFKERLPKFLRPWLDDEQLQWGGLLETELRSAIQSGMDFLIIFLGSDAMSSTWVKKELAWALQSERETKRRIVLPILLPGTDPAALPEGLSQRISLRLNDYGDPAIEDLAELATEKLFQLTVENYSALQLEIPPRKSLTAVRDDLSANQAKLLDYVVKQCRQSSQVMQRSIEDAMQYPRGSGELYYRLETLIHEGFLEKRRNATDGTFSYRLNDEFRASLAEPKAES
jgi:hypothetical protein